MAVNDFRVYFLDIFITDVPAVRYRRPEVELDNISFGTELFKDILCRILVQVQGHVIFGWVDVHEHRALFLVEPPEGIQGTRHISHRG